MHKCKNHGKRVCIACLLATIAFPVEHMIWERTPVLKHAMAWMIGG